MSGMRPRLGQSPGTVNASDTGISHTLGETVRYLQISYIVHTVGLRVAITQKHVGLRNVRKEKN